MFPEQGGGGGPIREAFSRKWYLFRLKKHENAGISQAELTNSVGKTSI